MNTIVFILKLTWILSSFSKSVSLIKDVLRHEFILISTQELNRKVNLHTNSIGLYLVIYYIKKMKDKNKSI